MTKEQVAEFCCGAGCRSADSNARKPSEIYTRPGWVSTFLSSLSRGLIHRTLTLSCSTSVSGSLNRFANISLRFCASIVIRSGVINFDSDEALGEDEKTGMFPETIPAISGVVGAPGARAPVFLSSFSMAKLVN